MFDYIRYCEPATAPALKWISFLISVLRVSDGRQRKPSTYSIGKHGDKSAMTQQTV